MWRWVKQTKPCRPRRGNKGDNATSNTNTRGDSPTKRARAEHPTVSTQPEQSRHGSRTSRSGRARKPRALSQASRSDTLRRVQVGGKSSSVTNQNKCRKRCKSCLVNKLCTSFQTCREMTKETSLKYLI